jgi:hypothetical protein
VDGVAVVEPLGDHRRESTFKFFDLASELVEIVIELLVLNIHDIVVKSLELIHSLLELHKNLLKSFSKGFSLGASELDLGQLVELHNGVGQMEDVVATFEERVESYEQGVGGEFPGVLGLGLVLEIGIFELGADVDGGGEFFTGFVGLFG